MRFGEIGIAFERRLVHRTRFIFALEVLEQQREIEVKRVVGRTVCKARAVGRFCVGKLPSLVLQAAEIRVRIRQRGLPSIA